jgi:site-specific recombinase XerD
VINEKKMEKYWIDLMSLKTEMIFRNFSNETIRKYMHTVREFLYFTDKNSDKINKKDILNYLSHLESKNYKENTLHHKQVCINFFMKNILGKDVKETKYKRKVIKKEYLTKKEFDTLLKVSNSKQSCMWYLLWIGSKSHEIVNITIHDYNINKGVLKVGNKEMFVSSICRKIFYTP